MEYFILSEDFPLRSDFEFVPCNSRLILIAKLVTLTLTDQQRRQFSEIVLIDNFDVEHIVSAIKSRVKTIENARIIANDDTIFQIVASVRNRLGIAGPSLDELLPFCCKYTSKKRLEGSSVHYPKFMLFDYQDYLKDPVGYVDVIGEKIGFPMVVKPTNLAGSLETQKINHSKELAEWCSKYDPQTILKSYGRDIPFIFEAFISIEQFELFHCDSIIRNGQVVFTQVSRYAYPCMEVGTHGKSHGSIFIPDTMDSYKALYELPKLVITSFQRFAPVPNGVMHLEAFRNRHNRQIIFLETQLRSPGGDICSSYNYALGINLAEIDYRLQMNLPISIIQQEPLYTAWLQIPTQTGVVEQLVLPKIRSRIFKMDYGISVGQKTERPLSLLMHHRTALSIIIGNRKYDELVRDFDYLKDFKPFVCHA